MAAQFSPTRQFRNPLNSGADPSLVYHDGRYLLMTTQGDRLSMWQAASLPDLVTAPRTDVWIDSEPSRSRQLWAPALHRFPQPSGGRWFVYYTAGDGSDASHRMYVLESESDDPAGPYRFKGRIADFGEYAIDGEPFILNGQPYFVWSGPGRGMNGPAQLYICAMRDPWTTVGEPVAIPAAGGCPEVREGPTPLYGDNRTFLTYSTCDTGKPDYQLWMKSIEHGAEPLNPDSWVQHDGPIFAADAAAGVWGPGHHFFFKSPDGGEDWIAYHGKNTPEYNYSFRTTRVQRFSWNRDGTPDLGTPLPADRAQWLPAGDPGPGTEVVYADDVAAEGFHVSYTGDWVVGDGRWSQQTGAAATFFFTGSQVALFGVRSPANGHARFYVDDGKPSQPYDLYSDVQIGEHPCYISPKLEYGRHSLTVVVTGQRNTAASAAFVNVGRAEVYR